MIGAASVDIPRLPELIDQLGRPSFGATLIASMRSMCRVDMCSAFVVDVNEEMQYLFSSGGGNVTDEVARRVSNDYADRYWRRDPVFTQLPQRPAKRPCAMLRRLNSRAIADREYSRVHRQTRVAERLSLYRFGSEDLLILSLYRQENSGLFDALEAERLEQSGDILLSLVHKHAEMMAGTEVMRRHPPIAMMKDRLLETSGLSEREAETCAMIVAGYSAKEIARDTGLSLASVTTYRKRSYEKLGVSGRTALSRLYDRLVPVMPVS